MGSIYLLGSDFLEFLTVSAIEKPVPICRQSRAEVNFNQTRIVLQPPKGTIFHGVNGNKNLVNFAK